MKDLLTTMEINSRNYTDQVAQIAAALGIDQADLSFWLQFGTQTAPQFRRQIAADLSYFDQGTGLISQTITTIRAIVEIDQADRDRDRQRQDQALQDNIAAIGVGVATGAIVASSSGLMLEPLYVGRQKLEPPFNLHPFALSLILSGTLAVVTWFVTKRCLKQRRDKKP
jgi:uncharacterized phage infection (PIP) family protein YhgE